MSDRDAVVLPERIGGVALMPLSPDGLDLEIRWQVHPTKCGHRYGAETGHALAHQAVEDAGISEVPSFGEITAAGSHRSVDRYGVGG